MSDIRFLSKFVFVVFLSLAITACSGSSSDPGQDNEIDPPTLPEIPDEPGIPGLPDQPVEPSLATCVEIMGFSQTLQMFNVDDSGFEAGLGLNDTVQLFAAGGLAVSTWEIGGRAYSDAALESGCVDSSGEPEVAVLTVSGSFGEDVSEWVNGITEAIKGVAAAKPSVEVLVLESVIGGPNGEICAIEEITLSELDGCGGPDFGEVVRASEQYPFIVQAINQVLDEQPINGLTLRPGQFPTLASCAEYCDSKGHLDLDSRYDIGERLGTFYKQNDTLILDSTADPLPDPIGGVEIIDTFPCGNSDEEEVDCSLVLLSVDPDNPNTTLDDELEAISVALAIRTPKQIPLKQKTILFDAGGKGEGYGPTFGSVAPGNYQQGGTGYGDDLIKWYNDAGYITVDIIYSCSDRNIICQSEIVDQLVPYESGGAGWFKDTGGAGYAGIGSREYALIEWVATQYESPIAVHAHSSGSGRVMTALTRYDAAPYLSDIVLDGGPVFAYIPWYCNATIDQFGGVNIDTLGPLGPMNDLYYIEGKQNHKSNYDLARDNNNGADDGDLFTNCKGGVYTQEEMLDDSNFYSAKQRNFPNLNLGVVLGAGDDSPAPAHARLWFNGYQYEQINIPAISANRIEIVQGYCSDSSGSYFHSDRFFPCSDWEESLFETASDVSFDASLGQTTHNTAADENGAKAVFNLMRQFLGET